MGQGRNKAFLSALIQSILFAIKKGQLAKITERISDNLSGKNISALKNILNKAEELFCSVV
jgi:hypothetical protein